MLRRPDTAILLSVALLAGALLPLAAQAEETFTGGIARPAGVAPSRGMPNRLIMTVREWSTQEDRDKLLKALQEGGQEAVSDVLGDMRKGFLRYPTSTSWPINHAWSEETEDGGRIVRLVTERPILFGEAYRNWRTLDYIFGIVELRLDAEGEGEGVILPGATVELNEQGQVVVEQYGAQPNRLLAVTTSSD